MNSEHIHIRKAAADDSKAIATLIMIAMNDIVYQFIGEKSPEKAIQFLENLTGKQANQYSFENCWVVECGGELVAAANIYDGAELQRLRAPVAEMIKTLFNREFDPEDETGAGELYIDTIAVQANRQGKGIGTKLLQFLIDEYVMKRHKTIGLLVDKDNPNAKRLYLRAGFKTAGEKIFAGKRMEHLQINSDHSRLH